MSEGKLHPDYLGIKTKIGPERLGDYEGLGYVLQEKFDGWWCHLEVNPIGNILMTTRRDNPIKDAGLSKVNPLLVGTRLIGEWMPDTGRVWLFDIIQSETEDLRLASQEYRRFRLATLLDKVNLGPDVSIVPEYPTGFSAVYEAVILQGGEGVVLKNTQSLYHSSTKDQKTALWVKCKPDYYKVGHLPWEGGEHKWKDPDLQVVA